MAAASFKSFPEMFLHRVHSTPDADAFYHPVHDEWKTMSWREVGERVKAIACGLHSIGIEKGDPCSLACNTRVEWVLCDLAILGATGATTTIYPSSKVEDVAFIVEDSGTTYVFAEDQAQLDKLLEIREQIPKVRKVILIDGAGGHDGWVIGLSELERLGREWDKNNPGAYEARAGEIGSEDLATLIYTSGTTGNPKGVKLVHDCWVFEGEAMDALGFLSPADKQYLWLPLSHSFGKVLQAAIIRIGIPTAIDGRIDKIVSNLAVVQPTFMGAVPRIFEKVYNKVVTQAEEAGGLKLKIFRWAISVGREVSALKQKGQQPGGMLSLKFAIADKLVFSKLKALFGGKVRFFISGGAPLNREIAEFFHAAGILILEGYGLTESSAASFVNRPDRYKFGTVGPALPGVDLRIAEEDGEILIHGRGIMRGYHNRPDATEEALTEDGWLRTGDIGQLDADGMLKITDRKKDLIKTSGGKYVAPQEIEGRLKTRSPLIGQVLVHGNNRNFCSALLTINPEELPKWAAAHGKGEFTLEAIQKDPALYQRLVTDPEMRSAIEPFVAELNSQLASYESLKKFAILPADFTIETDELTPSLKVKRKVVETRYKDILEEFYAGSVK